MEHHRVRRPSPRARQFSNAHAVDELTWVREGRLVLRIGGQTLTATPHRTVYVPAGVEHDVEPVGNTTAKPLFLSAVHHLGDRALALPRTDALNRLAAPLDEPGPGLGPAMAQFMDALLPWVRTAPPPLPEEPRARHIARHLLAEPAASATLGELAAAERVSARTVQRAFLKETGLSFSQWRARCRLSAGAERLREGASVTQAARACGHTPSTFIARYRAEFGITPGREAHQLRA